MNYLEAIDYVMGATAQGTMLGLERVKELLNRMGNPEKQIKVIHVAGTNGKGSTCVMLAAILNRAGYKTGLFTSPYLHSLLEYLQIDGTFASEEDYAAVASYVKGIADEMPEAPTEFELSVGMAFYYYTKQKCDILVLETGLGGRLDATNVVEDPLAVILTNIGIDHIGFLGNTLGQIALEKAGIIKEASEVVLYTQEPEAEKVIEEKAQEQNARLHRVDFQSICLHFDNLEGQTFSYKDWKNLQLSLLGEFQLRNATVVLECIQVLREKGYQILEPAVRSALAQVTWPGRFELLLKHPYFIVDGGHNDQCIHSVVQGIKRYFPKKKVVFLTGVMEDKDYPAMYDQLYPFAKAFVAVEPKNPRALPLDKLSAFLLRYDVPVKASQTIKDGVADALSMANENDVVFALGSLYMMSELRESVKTFYSC